MTLSVSIVISWGSRAPIGLQQHVLVQKQQQGISLVIVYIFLAVDNPMKKPNPTCLIICADKALYNKKCLI